MADHKPVKFSKRLVYASDYIQDALIAKRHLGVTDLYSTGVKGLDQFLGGGYGTAPDWEIVVIHGSYGVGKSTVALNFVAQPILSGVRVGIIALEDSPAKMVLRLAMALGDQDLVGDAIRSRRIRLMPKESKEKFWTLDEMLQELETWFTDPINGVDLILVDHLQMLFDSADMSSQYTEWKQQDIFMRGLNRLMERTKKTIVLVSQENREGQVAGSIGIRRAASKMIGISKVKGAPGKLGIKMTKSRDTAMTDDLYIVELRNAKLYDSKDQPGTHEDLF